MAPVALRYCAVTDEPGFVGVFCIHDFAYLITRMNVGAFLLPRIFEGR